MLSFVHPLLIVQLHENNVKEALHKAEQARLMRAAKSAQGTDEWVLRRLIPKLWNWVWPPVIADHSQLTWKGRPSH